MQRTLTARDDGAALTILRQFQATQQSGQTAADNHRIKLHRAAPFPARTAPDRPSG
ncbi:hypothetical protein D3C76_1347140 [compost metagenome]